MIEQILNQHKPQFEQALAHLHTELSSVRTGRASAGLLATVLVESYGSRLPLLQLANVSVADAKTLVVSPWDKGQLVAVEKGILAANLGFTPNNDGQIIRINLPPMSEERRKEMVKLIGQMAERAKISVRNIREDTLKALKREESQGQISKDDLARGQKKLQESVDKLNAEIKNVAEAKEKEVMTV